MDYFNNDDIEKNDKNDDLFSEELLEEDFEIEKDIEDLPI